MDIESDQANALLTKIQRDSLGLTSRSSSSTSRQGAARAKAKANTATPQNIEGQEGGQEQNKEPPWPPSVKKMRGMLASTRVKALKGLKGLPDAHPLSKPVSDLIHTALTSIRTVDDKLEAQEVAGEKTDEIKEQIASNRIIVGEPISNQKTAYWFQSQ